VSSYSEARIAQLLTGFPPAPEAWVRAAAELPVVRRGLDDLVRRARADSVFRQSVIADLERVLRDEGMAPHPATVEALRHRLGAT
jgi:hypothetical protein